MTEDNINKAYRHMREAYLALSDVVADPKLTDRHVIYQAQQNLLNSMAVVKGREMYNALNKNNKKT